MPIVSIAYAGSPPSEARARLISRVTETVTQEFAVPASAVNVVLMPIAPDNWGVAGETLEKLFRTRPGNPVRASSEPPRDVYTTHRGVRLHALDFKGHAPAVLIVPGITSPAATWQFVVDALQLPNRVLITDCRGRGRSDAPATGYSLADYVADLEAWQSEFGLENPIIVGHSMGARIAAAFTSRHNSSPLVAIEPPLSGPDRPYPTPLSFYTDGLASISAASDLTALRARHPGWSDERIRDRIEWLPTCSLSAVRESYQHFHDESFLSDWSRGRGAALFVRGGDSPVVLDTDLAGIAELRGGADIAVVEGAGHMIPWDSLAGFVATVGPWIARHSAGPDSGSHTSQTQEAD